MSGTRCVATVKDPGARRAVVRDRRRRGQPPRPFRQREWPRMYRPLVPGDAHPARLVFRVRGAGQAATARRLRELAIAVDPMLRLSEIKTVEASLHENDAAMRVAFAGLLGIALSVVLLSAAGRGRDAPRRESRAHLRRRPARGCAAGASGAADPADGGVAVGRVA